MSVISTRFTSLVGDPTRCLDMILQDLNDTGVEVVDASNAFVLLMETTTQLASQNWINNEIGLRRRYASLASNYSELYPHMSSTDIHLLFAQPTSTAVRVSILLESLLVNAVNTGQYREAIIPRYTEIVVDDLYFSLDLPVSIKVYNNRIFKASYVGGTTLHTDVLQVNGGATYSRPDGSLWVSFEIEVRQQNWTPYTLNAISGITFNEQVSYTDQLSSLEIRYMKDGVYVPMHLSLGSSVYDPLVPTAIVTIDTQLKAIAIFIPSIYTLNGVSGNIQVIIGTTLGDVDRVFTHYTPDDYQINLDTSQYTTTTKESAFLASTSTVEIIRPLDGGRDAMSFNALRSRILNRGFGSPDLPITKSQVSGYLSDLGLTSVIYEEGIGGRTYVITDDTPHPTVNGQPPLSDTYYSDVTQPTTLPAVPDDYLAILAKQLTYAGKRSRAIPYDTQLSIGALTITLSYQELINLPSAVTMNNKVVITPGTLFVASGTDVTVANISPSVIDALPVASKLSVLNSNDYLFSMFYYLVEPIGGEWRITPWSMNIPEITIIDSIASDSTLPDMFKRQASSIYKIDNAYLVSVSVTSIATTGVYASTDTFAVLKIPVLTATGTTVVTVDATITDDGIYTTYEFEIPLSGELSSTAIGITVDGNQMVSGELWVDIIYGLLAKPLSFQGALGDIMSDPALAPLLQERMYLTLATPLPNLWTNSHSLGDRINYLTYEADEPYVITTSDTSTSMAESVPFIITSGCEIQYKPVQTTTTVVTVNNEIAYKHRKGDLVLDSLGRPIPSIVAGNQISFDMIFVDARAVYCTDSAIFDQLELVQADIVNKCTTVIPKVYPYMLERTSLYYRPIRTIGDAVLVNTTMVGTCPTNIKPIITLGVSSTTFADSVMKRQLADLTVATINLSLTRDIISQDKVIADLYGVYGSSVITVKVEGLPEVLSRVSASIKDKSTRVIVSGKIITASDQTLTLADNIVINYVIVK